MTDDVFSIRVDGADATAAYFAALAAGCRQAVSDAINVTAREGLETIRLHLDDVFTIRQRNLVRFVAPLNLAPPRRARPNRLAAILETEGTGRILNPFETGIPHTGTLAQPVAVPTSRLRVRPATIIPRYLYPHNLGLVARRDPSGRPVYNLGRGALRGTLTPYRVTPRGVVIQGKRGTFVLDHRYHKIDPSKWGVYIRVAPGRGGIRMLWRFTRQVSRPASLKFRALTQATVDRRWPINMEGAWRKYQAIIAARTLRTGIR